MSVKGKYEDTEHVKFKTLSAVKVASCIIKESYEQMTGPMFIIYHVSPAQTQNPDEYVTEACFPVE